MIHDNTGQLNVPTGNGCKSFFLVGMPRSGTKLLRALLDNHPQIAIPSIETEFLPYWTAHWDTLGKGIKQFDGFARFYDTVTTYPYFIYMAERKSLISARDWYDSCRSFGPAGVFDALIRHDAGVSGNMLWGDKSPSYIKHIGLLKNLFPQTKIIHLLRDVRDYCLSINKAWGKNMLRAAQRWHDDVEQACKAMAMYPEDCLHVRYEDLLDEPVITLEKLCAFLDVPFDNNMLAVPGHTENIGNAKGARHIVQTNQQKFRAQLSPRMIERIETITWPLLQKFEYSYAYQGKLKRIPDLTMKLYTIFDGYNIIKSESRKRGLVNSILFHARYTKISGNRS